MDGQKLYMVNWICTCEPLENIGDEMMQKWELIKHQMDPDDQDVAYNQDNISNDSTTRDARSWEGDIVGEKWPQKMTCGAKPQPFPNNTSHQSSSATRAARNHSQGLMRNFSKTHSASHEQ